MVRNFHEDLKSRWFLVDVVEGFVVILVRFVLLGEFLHSSFPFFLYFVESPVDVSFDLSLFAGEVLFLFPFSFVLFDSSVR